ncbi:P-loop containing nucleoside triphosphate hydrolase [Phytophthora cactorum]|nr:P-loop containing nucleoside triphosphate hydrolase [Phytophthora cactorum]
MADTMPIVPHSAAQRVPQLGEPVCVVCGRYGEYVCDATDQDILVSAPTGTGKTASYLIPAIAQVLLAREEEEEVLALVLAPVRELAIQIETVAKLLMRGIADMKTAFLVADSQFRRSATDSKVAFN